MKTNSTQQEIYWLQVPASPQGNVIRKMITIIKISLSEKQLLEEACWNGLLPEMLPEIYEKAESNKLYLWQVREAQAFIEIELGEVPAERENYLSIDPYSFLPAQFLS